MKFERFRTIKNQRFSHFRSVGSKEVREHFRNDEMQEHFGKIQDFRKAQIIVFAVISLLVASPGALAVKMLSGPNLIIDSPVNDDVIASGGIIDINAPVAGAILLGGNINVNAPVAGDIIVAGGNITVNAPVGGKIVAAGGNIGINGNATNLVIAGGSVVIGPGAVIRRDAIISGSDVVNKGRIEGNLTVRATNFRNTGSAGYVDYVKTQAIRGFARTITMLWIIETLGFLILGMILLRLFPAQFHGVKDEIRDSTAKKAVAGFILIIASAILIVLAAISIVGLPAGAFALLIFVVALVLSPLFSSFALGKMLAGRESKSGDMWIFIIGFLVLNILFLIPFVGALIWLVAVSLGYGAIYYALRKRWHDITSMQSDKKYVQVSE